MWGSTSNIWNNIVPCSIWISFSAEDCTVIWLTLILHFEICLIGLLRIWRRMRTLMAEIAGPNGMGRCHEQHPRSGRRSHPPRAKLWWGCRIGLLEEFWSGNIKPTEYDIIACKEVLYLITLNEEKLQTTITDE